MDVKVRPPTVRSADQAKEATWTLVGEAPEGCCSQCWAEHEPEVPHNRDSLQYQYRFYAEHDRWPTWADAMAHCTPDVKRLWVQALARHGVQV